MYSCEEISITEKYALFNYVSLLLTSILRKKYKNSMPSVIK